MWIFFNSKKIIFWNFLPPRSSNTCANGKYPMNTSFSESISIASENALSVATRLVCVKLTPLGVPVEPLVYIIIAMSLAIGKLVSEIYNSKCYFY